MTKNKSGGWGGWILISLFALPFAACGTFMGYSILSQVWSWHELRTWQEAPAVIQTVELHRPRSSNSNSKPTYRVSASYTYGVAGHDYTGRRVSLSGVGDNLGSYQKKRFAELKLIHSSGEAFRCYYNPNAPEQAILFRDLRPEMIVFKLVFVILFGGVGYGLLVGAFLAQRSSTVEAQVKRDYPQEPWRWNKNWREGNIRSSTLAAMIGACIAAVAVNLLAWPSVFLLLPDALRNRQYPALIALVFPALGLGLLYWAGRCLWQWRKFGVSSFEMARLPGLIGGDMAGVVHTQVGIRPEDGFHLCLKCLSRDTRGTGKNRTTSETTLWEAKRILKCDRLSTRAGGSAIPVSFGIPYECRSSDDSDRDHRIVWKLTVSAAVPGVDYSAEFEVPVFKTSESSPTFRVEETLEDKQSAATVFAQEIKDAGIRILTHPDGGVRIMTQMGRYKGIALMLTVFSLLFGGLPILLWGKIPAIFPVICAAVGMMMLWSALGLWFGKSRVEVRSGRLTSRSGFFGMGAFRTWPVAEIKGLVSARGMQSGNKEFYSIQLRLEDGKKVTLLKYLDGKLQAERLVEIMGKSLAIF
jgi:hypothetical protein